jgi:hypothetical protein
MIPNLHFDGQALAAVDGRPRFLRIFMYSNPTNDNQALPGFPDNSHLGRFSGDEFRDFPAGQR